MSENFFTSLHSNDTFLETSVSGPASRPETHIVTHSPSPTLPGLLPTSRFRTDYCRSVKTVHT